MRSSPACASRSSSLPNAFTENGQVGSRNISSTRGPWPQTRGSARHAVCFIRSFLFARSSRTELMNFGGGKLRGAIPSRAAHIVFLRIQVKHAHRSDLTRDPLEAGPVPALGAVRCDARHRRNEVSRCIGRRRAQANPIRELVASFLLYSPRFADHYSSRVSPPAHIVAARWFDEVTHAGRQTTEDSAIAARSLARLATPISRYRPARCCRSRRR